MSYYKSQPDGCTFKLDSIEGDCCLEQQIFKKIENVALRGESVQRFIC